MSRVREHLHPELLPQYDEFNRKCDTHPWLTANGYTVITTCTHRTHEEQQSLYDQGRTKPGPLCVCGGKRNAIGTCAKHPWGLCVTWAKPGESKHNFVLNGKPAAKAFDIALLRYGKPIWDTTGNGIDDDPTDDKTDSLEAWQRVGDIGKSCGLRWAGDWPKGKREFPHFEKVA